MGRSRWTVAGLGVLGSLALSAAVWAVFGTPALFLFVPVVPFVLGRGGREETESIARCPRCDFRTADSRFRYCPRDGAALQEP